jgi:hypothetical protein
MVIAAGIVRGQGNVELAAIQRVYVMPMSSGFDQYLVNRLRGIGNFRVVTDPAKADAYLTDRLGVSFETKLNDIEEKAKEEAEELKRAKSEKKEEAGTASESFKLAPPIVGSIGRAKGTYFLVDRQSRHVIWSAYEKPKDYQPKTLDKVAERVAEGLKKELGGKK